MFDFDIREGRVGVWGWDRMVFLGSLFRFVWLVLYRLYRGGDGSFCFLVFFGKGFCESVLD